MNDGLTFELRVFHAVSKALKKRALGLDPNSCSVFHRKPYHSRDRGADIIFDVSIEIRLQGESLPSIIWIWECKDYSSPISVDSVEEFHSKLQQIGSDRTKGSLISSAPFQVGSINYARANGIGLGRLAGDGKFAWLLARSIPQTETIASADPTFSHIGWDGLLRAGAPDETIAKVIRDAIRAPQIDLSAPKSRLIENKDI